MSGSRLWFAALLALVAFAVPAQDQEPTMKITDTSGSPHALLDAVLVNRVQLTDTLWAPRIETNRVAGIPHQYAECERTGRIDNFRRAAGLPTREPFVHRAGDWGIRAVDPGHPLFAGLGGTVLAVSAGVPTRDFSCYWDDPSAVAGAWLGDWENGAGKYVLGEYMPGAGRAIFLGTGAVYFDQPDGENAHAAGRDGLVSNILARLGAGRVGFVTAADDASLSAEEAAALAWLRARGGALVLPVATLAMGRVPQGVDVLWWHYTASMELPEAAGSQPVIAAVRGFVEEGGGLFLSAFAGQYLHTLGWEPAPPTTIRQAPADGFRGIYFNDSDVHKWVEAAAISLASHPDPELDALLDEVIGLFAAAQEENGYLDTYYMFDEAPNRWTDLAAMHELYIGGHMIQAAVAHHRATGKTNYLDVARKWADLCCERFGPGKHPGTPGHEEVEMALVELYRVTGARRYLDLASYFVEARGTGVLNGSPYLQDHAPVRDQLTPTGHAVRQMYLDCGIIDLYAETGDRSLLDAQLTQWASLAREKLYLTGGVGAERHGEAFGEAFHLPNDVAYAETCAAIGSFMWNWRLLQVTGEARFADLMEQTLYNGLLSGVGLDGKLFFYDNPLEVDGSNQEGTHQTCRRTSRHWDGCACCPPNVARTLAALPGYLYGVRDTALYAHHYVQGTAEVELSGQTVRVEQRTRYPWEGAVALTIDPAAPREFTLAVRWPGWAAEASVKVNGESVAVSDAAPGSYVAITRTWAPGDAVNLDFPMPVRQVQCDPRVEANRGRLALMRGPVVYCVEGTDHPDVPVYDLALRRGDTYTATWQPELLGGVVVLSGTAYVAEHFYAGAKTTLYRVAGDGLQGQRTVPLTAVPFHAWANREPGAMRVWLPGCG